MSSPPAAPPHRRRRRRPNQPRTSTAAAGPAASPAGTWVQVADTGGSTTSTFADLGGAATSTFADLGVPGPIVAALAAQGLVDTFPIQHATLPDALAGRDLLGQGRTGSGKTLAFAVPIVARLLALPPAAPARPRALILVPTRELAAQVAEVLAPLAGAVDRRVATVFGGVPHKPQLRQFAGGVDIVVACPGRLLDHLQAGALRLDNVAVCVLDEADHMADQGFLPMVKRIVDQVPTDAQQMLFSATLAGGVDVLVRRYLNDPTTHTTQAEPPATLVHHVVVVADADRVGTVASLVGDGRAVVFTRTKHRARQFARRLSAGGLTAVDMHGNLSQPARERNLAAFASGAAQVLVATDIAARGIHVDEVPMVIHADPPAEHKAYTHRSGRTARAGAAGVVFTVATADQAGDVRSLLAKANVSATWTGGRA
jgi:superfamily II DNA/RNA helicase